ncbi:collagen alpha-1(III) chain-like [Suncus etruscus]|uniref:collagen alpha-1(III) chain-like n=1 Tax=Suncus etruscus TaxID=109475 RepID=UPI002110A7C1|nr:collagen alpha-1(III) chain-like [Suncus etruscus]
MARAGARTLFARSLRALGVRGLLRFLPLRPPRAGPGRAGRRSSGAGGPAWARAHGPARGGLRACVGPLAGSRVRCTDRHGTRGSGRAGASVSTGHPRGADRPRTARGWLPARPRAGRLSPFLPPSGRRQDPEPERAPWPTGRSCRPSGRAGGWAVQKARPTPRRPPRASGRSRAGPGSRGCAVPGAVPRGPRARRGGPLRNRGQGRRGRTYLPAEPRRVCLKEGPSRLPAPPGHPGRAPSASCAPRPTEPPRARIPASPVDPHAVHPPSSRAPAREAPAPALPWRDPAAAPPWRLDPAVPSSGVGGFWTGPGGVTAPPGRTGTLVCQHANGDPEPAPPERALHLGTRWIPSLPGVREAGHPRVPSCSRRAPHGPGRAPAPARPRASSSQGRAGCATAVRSGPARQGDTHGTRCPPGKGLGVGTGGGEQDLRSPRGSWRLPPLPPVRAGPDSGTPGRLGTERLASRGGRESSLCFGLRPASFGPSAPSRTVLGATRVRDVGGVARTRGTRAQPRRRQLQPPQTAERGRTPRRGRGSGPGGAGLVDRTFPPPPHTQSATGTGSHTTRISPEHLHDTHV